MTDFTEEQIKQALIQNNGWNGGGVWNTSLNLTYSFGGTKMPYWNGIDYNFHGVDENTFKPLSSGQQAVFINAVALWESIANIHLTLGTPYSVTTGSTLSFGDIVVVGGKLTDETADASTISPTSTRSADSAGDIVIGNTGIANTHNNLLAPGQTGFNTFVHELGHALGLNHPINYPGDSSVTNPLPSDPGQRYTIMSYQPVKGIPGYSEWWASKPMLCDILAIQTLYGVNPNTNAEDGSRYTFKTGADAIQAIWDAGGVDDVIDAHDQTQDVTIDLQPGHFSFVGKDENISQQQIAIAYQIAGQENNWIENAIGGSGADKLIGNDGDNELTGGEGNDILNGGLGKDTYIFHAGDGFDTILDTDGLGGIVKDGQTLSGGHQQGGNNTFTGKDGAGDEHTYILVDGDINAASGATLLIDGSIEVSNYHADELGITLDEAAPTQAANTVMGTPDNADWLIGNAGNDIIEGLGENDVLMGFEGDDYLYSDTQITAQQAIINGNTDAGTGLKGEWLMDMEGNDTLISGTGNDVLAGGGGQDLLIAGAGDDEIFGDIVYRPLSFNWTVIDVPPYDRSFGEAIGGHVPPDAAADIIYAGDGLDHVWAGVGNDVIFGEGGTTAYTATTVTTS